MSFKGSQSATHPCLAHKVRWEIRSVADSVACVAETLGNSIGYGFGTRWMVLFLLSSFSEPS